MRQVAALIMFVVWIAGVVLAQGFWSTLASVFIPFWAWYLVVERIMQANGLLNSPFG
jgi:hypothetical protein